MKGTVLFGPRDIRFIEREDPKILEPADVIIRISATCVCGSDLWPFRGKVHSRANTSSDNSHSEAHFKTLECRPGITVRFQSIKAARTFCRDFVVVVRL